MWRLHSIIAMFVASLAAPKGHCQDWQPSRVAIVNIGEVFENHQKAKDFKKEMMDWIAPEKQEAKRLQSLLADAQNIGNQEAAEQFRLNLQALDARVREAVTKKQESQLEELHKAIANAIRDYAEEKKLDLVMGFGDPTDKNAAAQISNVQRKMHALDAGGVVPYFIRPRIDISQEIVSRLNGTYKRQK